MYTKDKQAQLEALGEPWPDCECHGEPLSWWHSADMREGGRFMCRVWNRQRMAQGRAERRRAGQCVWCGGELETESLCTTCAESHRESSWKHDQGIERQLRQRLHKMRRRATDEATGVAFVAFQDWMD